MKDERRGRLALRACRLWLCYDWEKPGISARRYRLPARARAYLRRVFRLGPAVMARIADAAEKAHARALADESFRRGRAARQAELGRRSGAARRAAAAERDAEIVRLLDEGLSLRAAAFRVGTSPATVARARGRLARAAADADADAVDVDAIAAAVDAAEADAVCERCDGARVLRLPNGREYPCPGCCTNVS